MNHTPILIIAKRWSTTLCFCWLLLFSFRERAFGQVVNDKAAGKIDLSINAGPFTSNTSGCTVERSCVDESLTGKCIEYHNDQWFGFTTRQAGAYYVNVSGQTCRDIKGIQLVVMEGTLCRPETYRILSCTSLATQDDIYVRLDLPANRSYLINVDGYLNDFCQFQIGVSTRSTGFPARSIGLKSAPDQTLTERWVQVEWWVSDSLAPSLIGYQLYRRHEKEMKSALRKRLEHRRNTRGESVLRYATTDTLSERGRYVYQIVGLRNDNTTVWLAEKVVDYRPDLFKPEDFLTLRLQYALNTPLTVLIFDAATDRLLRKSDFTYQRKGRAWQYYVGDLRAKSIYVFKVKVTDNLRRTSREYTVDTRKPPAER
jgi:hypothetical protein